MSATSSTGSEGTEMKESLAEIRARALRESAERRKQKVEETQAAQPAPLPTAAAQPVPSRQVQQEVTSAPAQQQQMTLQQAHDIGVQKGQQQSILSGFIAGVIICGGAFIIYKGACWALASPPARTAARRVAEVAQ